jgi:hypothetical protein
MTLYDQYQTYSDLFEGNAFDDQVTALKTSIYSVFKYIKLVPSKYRTNKNMIGAIANYVFQGIKSKRNKDVEIIGNQILQRLGRYDSKERKYNPLINE